MNAQRLAPIVGFSLLSVLLGCATRGAVAAGRPELVVASDLDNRPFAWVDDDGTPRGRDVEMMTLLGERIGLRVRWERMSFAELLPAVEAGRVDCACATLGVTPERAERVRFTTPYFDTTIAIVVRAGAGEPERLDGLTGRIVSAGEGTTSERAVRERLPHVRAVVGTKDQADTATRLASREIDAAAMDGPAAAALVSASDGRLRLLSESIAEERYAIAVAPPRSELVSELDRALAEVAGEGGWDALNRRYGLAP